MSCKMPGCAFHEEKNGYCVRHKFMDSTPIPKEKPPENKKPIPKRSRKMTEEMKEYKKEVKAYLSENTTCLIQSPVCTRVATAVNHKKRRGKNLRNQKYWEPCCPPCNLYIEEHPKWAYENEHLISIHSKTK